MNTDKYSLRPIFLKFRDNETETQYREHVIDRTLLYFRISWASVIVFGGIFGLLDHRFFKEDAHTIIAARIGVITMAVCVLGLSLWKPARPYFIWSPALFILGIGSFCILQSSLGPPDSYSPYVMGIFWAHAGGIFATVGMGFALSSVALLFSLVIFNIFLGVLWPVSPDMFLVYNMFITGITSIFIFIAYLSERVFREAFVVSSQLRDTLGEVKTLTGMLPMCAACKKIRDDKGYWNRIETYLSTHTDLSLTHGICPECAESLYPEYSHSKFPDESD